MIIKGQKLKPVKSSAAWQQAEPVGFEESFLADTTESMMHVPRQKSEHQHAPVDAHGALPKRRAVGPFEQPAVTPSVNAAQKVAIQHELDKMRAEAHTLGYEAGLKAAEHELQQLRIVIAELFGLKQAVLLSSADDISGLALQVAQHVLQHELETTPKQVEQYGRKAIKAATKTQKYVTVRLHPKDVDVLQEAFDAVSPVKRGTEFQLEADDTVDRGSCIIETDAGRVDKRLTVQFDILKRAFDQLPKLSHADLTPLAQDGEEA